MENKRGAIGIIIFFTVLFVVLIAGFGLTMVWGVMDIASDEITPIMEELGMVDDVNMSETGEYTFGILDDVVQAMPWLLAFSYVMALIFTLVFVFLVGYNPHPAFSAFYLAMMVLVVIGCVVISNMYQDIYTGTDELADRLQEQTIMSYLILHSPFIMAIIGVIGGVLMFGMQSVNKEGFGGQV